MRWWSRSVGLMVMSPQAQNQFHDKISQLFLILTMTFGSRGCGAFLPASWSFEEWVWWPVWCHGEEIMIAQHAKSSQVYKGF
jgi:hypothetical protein